MEKKTFFEAIADIEEYIKNTDFDIEYLETIYEYLLNKKIKIQ